MDIFEPPFVDEPDGRYELIEIDWFNEVTLGAQFIRPLFVLGKLGRSQHDYWQGIEMALSFKP